MTYLTQWARGIAVCFVMAGVFAALAPTSAESRVVENRKYGLWEYQHFVGNRLEWCGVKTNWPNNKMVLTIRLLENRLDYFFYNRDWNLRKRRKMGATVFRFGNRGSFSARTETLDSNNALFGTFDARISRFVKSFKAARRMKISFPTNQSIGVNLKGSSAAINAAIRCWNRNLNY